MNALPSPSLLCVPVFASATGSGSTSLGDRRCDLHAQARHGARAGASSAPCFQITPFAELQTSGAITARAAFRISGEWSALYALLPR